jgi:hypothetical protein
MRTLQRMAVGTLVAIALATTLQAQDMWQTIVNNRFFDPGTFTSPSVTTPAEITSTCRTQTHLLLR